MGLKHGIVGPHFMKRHLTCSKSCTDSFLYKKTKTSGGGATVVTFNWLEIDFGK